MKKINLPWGAWYGDNLKTVELPESWAVDMFGERRYELKMKTAAQIKQEANILKIVALVKNKFHNNSIKNGIGIVVDDLTRPTSVEIIVRNLIKELKKEEIENKFLHIFISTGAHRVLQRDDLLKKIGEYAFNNCTVHHHFPHGNTVFLGKTRFKTPIYVNKFFMEMDFKICIGGVLPHSSVGFSGGAKLLVPGLAGIKTIAAFHRSEKGRHGKFADIRENILREDIDEAGKMIPIDFFIQVVSNPDRSIAKIFSGENQNVHLNAVKYVKEKASFKIDKQYDIAICNAYPLDTEFIQSGKALDAVRISKGKIIKDNGVIVLCSAASEGYGFHGLRSPGAPKPFEGNWAKPFGNKKLIFFCENINPNLLPEETISATHFFSEWKQLFKFLVKTYKKTAEVAVFPFSSIQIPVLSGELKDLS